MLTPFKPIYVKYLLLFISLTILVGFNANPTTARTMPEFGISSPDLWINSKPLTKSDLKGKVVLIEVWTSI